VASSPAFAQTTKTETAYVTIDGEVVRYDVGQSIVIRGADNKEVVYTLAPGVVVPADVAVGRRVQLFTEPGTDGKAQLVSRITTTSITPEGDLKRTTKETRKLPSGVTTSTTTTAVSGTVAAYEAGKTLTVTQTDGTKVTYLINTKSSVPDGMVIGKSVTIVPLSTTDKTDPVVHTITYVTTATAVSGTVAAYAAGKTLTVTQADGTKVTYLINTKSSVPDGMVIGKSVTIVPLSTPDKTDPVVHTITYVTTTKSDTVSRR
jgi:hypothetical protein